MDDETSGSGESKEKNFAVEKNEKAPDYGLIDHGYSCEPKSKKLFVDDTEEQIVTKLWQVEMPHPVIFL